MTREWLPKPVYKYNDRQDVLNVFYSDRVHYYGDEEYQKDYPYLYVLRDDDTEEVIGFTILDYSKYKAHLPELYPEYFKNLDELP